MTILAWEEILLLDKNKSQIKPLSSTPEFHSVLLLFFDTLQHYVKIGLAVIVFWFFLLFSFFSPQKKGKKRKKYIDAL